MLAKDENWLKLESLALSRKIFFSEKENLTLHMQIIFVTNMTKLQDYVFQ